MQFSFYLVLLIAYIACSVAKPLTQSQVDRLMQSINRSAREKGGVYADYSCKEVSWDDGDRGTVDGQLSVWGASITDTRLWAKDGQQLFTVRSDNWNEKLGHVKASEVKLIVGNDQVGGELETVTLKDFLQKAGLYGGYAGLPPDLNLANPEADDKVSIRFQTTFLPVEDKEKATLEFATEAYNYNTLSDEDPKNIVVLATTQGIAVQQDGEGAKKLYHHSVEEGGLIHRYWLEAERTRHKVGGPQLETSEEKEDAENRGKATAKEIGIEAMGKRFNVLMTIQVPLNQTTVSRGGFGFGSFLGGGLPGAPGPVEFAGPPPMPSFGGVPPPEAVESRPEEKKGESNAARVSLGSEVDVWDGLTVKNPKRHPTQHVTITAVLYNTIAGGVPKVEDVVAAIDDMEKLYKACNWNGNLIDKEAEFMKTELNSKETDKIGEKICSQPYPSWVGGILCPETPVEEKR